MLSTVCRDKKNILQPAHIGIVGTDGVEINNIFLSKQAAVAAHSRLGEQQSTLNAF